MIGKLKFRTDNKQFSVIILPWEACGHHQFHLRQCKSWFPGVHSSGMLHRIPTIPSIWARFMRKLLRYSTSYLVIKMILFQVLKDRILQIIFVVRLKSYIAIKTTSGNFLRQVSSITIDIMSETTHVIVRIMSFRMSFVMLDILRNRNSNNSWQTKFKYSICIIVFR